MPRSFELRQSQDRKHWTLSGYASRTGVPYKVNDHRGSYDEVIERGAFAATLKAGADVVLATEHAPPFVARTPRTLKLEEDANGLRVRATMDHDDPDVRALVSKVRNGILPEMSLAFRADDNFAGTGTRSIRALSLDGGDVSVVRRGANRSTEVSVRGRAPGMFEVRSSGLITLRQEPLAPADEGEEVTCPQCDGSGQVDGETYPALCQGTGEVDKDDLDESERSARRSSAPSVAELEIRVARARSALAEEHFEETYGARLVQIEAQHVMHYGRLAGEALARGDAKAATRWIRLEALEIDRLALEL